MTTEKKLFIEIDFETPDLLALVNVNQIVYVANNDGKTYLVKLNSEKEAFIAKKNDYLDSVMVGKV